MVERIPSSRRPESDFIPMQWSTTSSTPGEMADRDFGRRFPIRNESAHASQRTRQSKPSADSWLGSGAVICAAVRVMAHVYGDELRHARLLHGDAVDDVQAVIMRLEWVTMTNCVSRLMPAQHVGESADVGFVQRRVDFVQHAERAGLVLEDADQQRQRSEGLFAAGEQQHVLQLLARRRGNDVDAALREFSSSVRRMKAWPPSKSVVKVTEKFSLMRAKASSNFVREIGVDLLDGGLRVLDGVEQVLALRLKEARDAPPSRCTPRGPSC